MIPLLARFVVWFWLTPGFGAPDLQVLAPAVTRGLGEASGLQLALARVGADPQTESKRPPNWQPPDDRKRPPPGDTRRPGDQRHPPGATRGQPPRDQRGREGRPPPRPRTTVRNPDTTNDWMVWLILMPLTLLFLGLAGWAIWRARKTRGLIPAVVVSLVLGFGSIWPTLLEPTELVLNLGANHTDPINSIETVAAIQQGFWRLSGVTQNFSFPEGAPWVNLGPTVLGYLLPSVLSLFSNAAAAHNLGVGLSMALLILTVWAFARSFGIGPYTSLLAAAGAAFAPVVLRELDQLSLDRATLFLVPVFFLCFHKAAREPGWRWPVASGVALAAVFYGQTYYGMYLAAACPLLMIPRLVGRDFGRRLLRMAITGAVALALMGPGFYILHQVSKNTNWETNKSLKDTAKNIWQPVPQKTIREYIKHHKFRHLPMRTPEERLMASMTLSTSTLTFKWPTDYIPGGWAYWGLMLMALALSTRRLLTLLTAVDVAVLLLLSMGPFLQDDFGLTNIPLPYYAYFLYVPGFEQLKNVNRIVLLAATISVIPLALGLSGLWERLENIGLRVPTAARIVAVAVAAFCVTSLHLPERRELSRPPETRPPLVTYPNPKVQRYAIPEAMAKLEAGPAMFLPVKEPSPPELSVAAMQLGWKMTNHPTYGLPRRLPLPFWFESNTFLNTVIFASGSNRANRSYAMKDPDDAMAKVKKNGLRYIAMFRHLMPGKSKIADTEKLLDKYMKKVADDGKVAVWTWRTKNKNKEHAAAVSRARCSFIPERPQGARTSALRRRRGPACREAWRTESRE